MANSGALHPGELELAHYLRGTLPQGHAAAVFAHAVLCRRCRQRLESLLADTRPAPATAGFIRTEDPEA